MIIHNDSHTDHAITQAQWHYILNVFEGRMSFFIETIELPQGLGHVMNGLYGPSCGDANVAEESVYYARRPPRTWKSRMTKLPARPTRFIRVIAGPHKEKCTRCDGTGVGPYSEMMHAGSFPVPGGFSCAQCVGGIVEHACILYTAYGVARMDMPTAPKEPGDIRTQLEEAERKRYGLNDRTDEHKALTAQIVSLREKRAEADAFWRTHALATEAS